MNGKLSAFSLHSRASAALAELIRSFESLEQAGEAIDVSKSTAGRLASGQVKPDLDTFINACVHERDHGVPALFDALVEDFYGRPEGRPLDVERDASAVIGDAGSAIVELNKALADGRVDDAEADRADDLLATLIRHAMELRNDIRARRAAARKA
jgi:hypothetical protein